MRTITYEKSGVSVDRNDRMVEEIQEMMKSTHSKRVISYKGFAAIYDAGLQLPIEELFAMSWHRIKRAD